MGLLAIVAAFFVTTSGPKEWAHYQQPRGSLRVVVYRLPLSFAVPGSSGDAPARVQLENASGSVLQRADVGSLQVVTEPEWERGRVRMKLVFDWQLPAGAGPR